MTTSTKRKPKETVKKTVRKEETTSLTSTPLIFISHDTRDGEIAEAFSRLLSSVSAGVLKSFRSSDQKGTQGIEYGTEWYGEIMKKLDSASDVVCLLTPRSLERPWLLYEAGVAKGKLDKTVLGVALGIPLGKAATGPFAQFQNCDDSEEKLTSLVMQLVGRIPNAEPDREVIKTQVKSFKKDTSEILDKLGNLEDEEVSEETSVAELFEEVKVMFKDLPSRIERQVDPYRRKKYRRFSPAIFEELMFMQKKNPKNPIGILVLSSFFKEDMPWLYEIGSEIYKSIKSGKTKETEDLIHQFMIASDITRHNGITDKYIEEELYFIIREVPEFVQASLSLYSKNRSRSAKSTDNQDEENKLIKIF